MSKSTISTYQLFKMFPDNRTAQLHLESVRWNGWVVCPEYQSRNIYSRTGSRAGYHDCRDCKLSFTVRTGTVFERSHVPLNKWIFAIYLLMTSRKGISSLQLAKEIGVTQKTAWFILHRLRVACGSDLHVLRGIVEVDETYLGGAEANKHDYKKQKAGRGAVGKQAVLGMRQRDGNTIAMPVSGTSKSHLQSRIIGRVEEGSVVCTDEHVSYKGLDRSYEHHTVNHSAKEYVNEMCHINGIESVWALVKRGYRGIYHNWSMKHMARYIDEFTFRLNEGNVKRHSLDRLDSVIRNAVGKRLTYGDLTQ